MVTEGGEIGITGFPLTWKVGINLVRESEGILWMVREKCVSSELHARC